MEEERDNQETNNSLFTRREIEKIFLSDEATGEDINSRTEDRGETRESEDNEESRGER